MGLDARRSAAGWSAVMLAGFLYAETKAEEPLLPLTLFQNPVIGICSIGIFVARMGLFGVIIYLRCSCRA
jgi:hypothetical protein